MSFARLLPPLLLLVVLVVFALQNTAVLTVNFLIWSFQLSQALHIVLCGASGLLLGVSLCVGLRWRKRAT